MSGEKENFYTLEYGNSDGAIRFGSLESSLNGVKGEVISDVKLQGSYEGHYITFGKDGPREGWTLARCPGTFDITAGEYIEGPGKSNAFIVTAKGGDIVLKCENGDIRFEARNIELVANGPDNKNGNVKIKANETINLNAKNVNIDAEVAWSFLSSGVGRITCRTSMQMYAGFSKCVTASSSKKSSKLGGKDGKSVVKESFPK
jgi:hypothetical protein